MFVSVCVCKFLYMSVNVCVRAREVCMLRARVCVCVFTCIFYASILCVNVCGRVNVCVFKCVCF